MFGNSQNSQFTIHNSNILLFMKKTLLSLVLGRTLYISSFHTDDWSE